MNNESSLTRLWRYEYKTIKMLFTTTGGLHFNDVINYQQRTSTSAADTFTVF